MNKILSTILAITFSVALFFVLLFTSMEIIVFNTHYYQRHYVEHDIMADTEIGIDDLMIVTENMLDYLKDKRDTLDMQAKIDGKMEEVFGEREKLHMVDVKNLFLQGRAIRNVSFLIFLIILAISIWRDKLIVVKLLKSVKYVFSVAILLLLVLGGLFYIDFNKYFIIFHEIFFDNDLWLLNAKTDILINMVPEVFFYTIAMVIIAIFLGSIIITITASEIIWRKIVKK